jgi:predicted Holliday junction resolvase-like endonuclease
MYYEIFTIFLLVVILYLWYRYIDLKKQFDKKVRQTAHIISGKTLEKLLPFLKEFKFDPHDVRWIGDPIDIIIFDGRSKNNLKKIVLCEIKTGKSKLTPIQRRIKELIEKKRIEWKEFKIK